MKKLISAYALQAQPVAQAGALLLVLGLALYARVPGLLADFFWLDEAHRAWNVVRSDNLADVLRLAGKESTVFLMISEWAIGRLGLLIFGQTELAFRVWPVLFSLLAVTGAFLFVRRLAGTAAAFVAAFAIAVGHDFILHSREFKPFALDLALAIWAIYVAVAFRAWQRRHDILSMLLMTLYALSSISFVFVYPAVLAYRVLHRKHRAWNRLALMAVPGIVFLAVYWFWLRPQAASAAITNFWAGQTIDNAEGLRFALGAGLHYIGRYFLFGWVVAWIFYLGVAPVMSIIGRRDGVWLLLLTPLAVQIVVSALGMYPLFNRPSYYLYGIMVLAFGYGAGTLIQSVQARGLAMLSRALAVGLVTATIGYSVYAGVIPDQLRNLHRYPHAGGKKAFSRLVKHMQPGDVVSINYGAFRTFLFHREKLERRSPALARSAPDAIRLGVMDRNVKKLCASFKRKNGDLPAGQRVWLLTTHVRGAAKSYRYLLRRVGKLKTLYETRRASLMLLRLDRPVAALDCK